MLEHLDRQSAHRIHGDGREQGVAALLSERHQDTQDPINNGHCRRTRQNAGKRNRIQREFACDRIGRPLVGIGNCDREQL